MVGEKLNGTAQMLVVDVSVCGQRSVGSHPARSILKADSDIAKHADILGANRLEEILHNLELLDEVNG